MALKAKGGNRKVKTLTPSKKRKRKKDGLGTRAKRAVVPIIFTLLGAFGIWQCMDERNGSPLDPLETPFRNVDVGEGKVPDPTLVNETELLEMEQKETSNADLADLSDLSASIGADTDNDVSIEAAGEEVALDTEAQLEQLYPLHGVAYHFHTQIKEKPSVDARVLAYARRGATFRLSPRVSKEGCPRGWHEVHGGGYICDGKGVNVSSESITFESSPPEPRLNDAMPYDYKYVKRDGVAEYWKIPNEEEMLKTQTVFAAIEKRNDSIVSIDSLGNAIVATADSSQDVDTGELQDETNDTAVQQEINIAAVDTAIETPAEALEGGGVTEPDTTHLEDNETQNDAYELPPYVHMRMAKGYYISVNKTVKSADKAFQQTVRGRYIAAEELYPATPSSFEGVLLQDNQKLPIAFVVNGGARILTRANENAPLKNGSKVDRYSNYAVTGTITRGKREYVEIGAGKYLSQRVVGVASLVEPPLGVGENERWIDVDLSEQTLVAYEGKTPVFATLVSSGRVDFGTPKGEFRIYNKHISITMDDPDGGEEAYSIEDVPWTQYFKEGYALHAAFWHDRFGRVRSHGCINLSPADARRLFFWTGPNLSDGVHGVIATGENLGTRVVIHQ